MTKMAAIECARQSLLGLSIGDAFGETLFGDPREIERRVATRSIATRRPWRWTDDTAMALSIVEVLAGYDGIEPDALAAAFARRFAAEPDRGYGPGAAMRAAPIGAYFAGDLERVRAEALRSAEPTHTHADGAAGAVAVAVAAALATTGVEPARLIAEVIAYVPAGHVLEGLRRAAAIDLAAPVKDAAEALGTGLDVAAHDTVPFCLWVAARHLRAYEDALWTAASPMGDRDTNAAIVGGIVVMATGGDAVPMLWRAAAEPLPAK